MRKPRLATDYVSEVTSASLSGLAELFTILGKYRDALVLVGGWAPYFLLERYQGEGNDFRHVGSIDTDIAVNPLLVGPDEYATIVRLIKDRGYNHGLDEQRNPIPFSFTKTIYQKFEARVDFMTAPTEEAGKHRHIEIQPDLRARTAKGCEAVFKHNFKHKITATLPEDGEATIEIQIADLVGILTTKGMALGERYKEKDAYDIYAVIANYAGGPAVAADLVRPYINESAVREALDNICAAFSSRTAKGPSWVATFLAAATKEERDRIQTDAYVNVSEFLKLVSG
jgi:hypothetical protein